MSLPLFLIYIMDFWHYVHKHIVFLFFKIIILSSKCMNLYLFFIYTVCFIFQLFIQVFFKFFYVFYWEFAICSSVIIYWIKYVRCCFNNQAHLINFFFKVIYNNFLPMILSCSFFKNIHQYFNRWIVS